MTKRVKPYPLAEEDDVGGLTAEEDRLFTAISFGKLHRVPSLLPLLRTWKSATSFGSTPLIHSARNARREHVTFLIKLLLQSGSDVNAQDDTGMTSLMHLARAKGSVDALRTLMRCKQCDPDVTDKDGNTALMHAARAGHAEALVILLCLPEAARHADVDARNKEDLAALDLAVMEGQVECCQYLVEQGKADTRTVKDTETFTKLLSNVLSHKPSS